MRRAKRRDGSTSSVSWQARGLTRQLASLFWKMWSRQAWLQAMQVLIWSAWPRGLLHEVGVGQQGPRHRHHVGAAVGQHLLGHLGRVDAVEVTSGVAMPAAANSAFIFG
jgi:hypothetical protein